MILSTPLTGACFYIDAAGVYHRGLGQVITYVIAFYYVITSCIIVLKNMKLLTVAQRLCVLFYSAECIVLNIIQVFLFSISVTRNWNSFRNVLHLYYNAKST